MVENLSKFKDKQFKRVVIEAILDMATQNNYELVTDYQWLVSTLFTVAEEKEFETRIGDSLTDLALKLEDLRQGSILPKSFQILETKLETFKDMQGFLQSIVYLVTEYLDELDQQDSISVGQALHRVLASNFEMKESLKIALAHLVFKAHLKHASEGGKEEGPYRVFME